MGGDSEYTFTMPAKDLTIEAKFRRIFSSGGDGKWTEVKYIPIKINDEIVLTLPFTRTREAGHTVTDDLTLTPEQGAELAEKLSQAGQSTLHIVLPDENNEVTETILTLTQ